MIRLSRFIFISGFLCSTPFVLAQPTRLAVTPFTESGVTFTPYDPVASPIFAKLFTENPFLDPLKPYAAIINNSSGKAIVSITYRLLRGNEVVYSYFLDGVAPPEGLRPAIPAGSRYLALSGIGGGGWEEGRLARSPMKVPNDQIKQIPSIQAQRIGRDAPTMIELDTVIFEDWLVAGPDRSGTVADLRAQKQAAEEIGRDTLAALNAGLDPGTILSQFHHGSETRGDSLSVWKARFSHQIMQRPTPRAKRARAEELLRFPDLSKLHRNQ